MSAPSLDPATLASSPPAAPDAPRGPEAGAREEAIARVDELGATLLRTLEILHALRALLEIKPGLARAEFARFVCGALERLPELQALEWLPRVPQGRRAEFEAAARADGAPHYSLCELDPAGLLRPAAPRPEYWPVLFAEPAEENAEVLGLDLSSHPERRAAMERSAACGDAIATPPLRLAQGAETGLGFLVVLAVPAPTAVPVPAPASASASASVAGRPAGWTLAVFDIQRLVESLFAPLAERGLHLRIDDLADAELPVFSTGHASPSAPAWQLLRELTIAGRVWRFCFTPGDRFRPDDPLWLARAAAMLRSANHRLEKSVAARTAALDRANRELRAEASRREAAERALARADSQLPRLSDAEARQWSLAGLVGRGERFGRLLRDIKAVQAALRTHVLILGESGTGKELVARAIHFGGAAAAGPFVRVDCSDLPDDGAQAEILLFGAVSGGGARGESPRRGFSEQADRGTLFFDEIGDLPLSLQARLLRVLEDGSFRPRGAEQARPLHARILAATHADLSARITEGRFRADLYFRLAQYPIAVPPLRERLEDVPALAQHFVRKIAAELKRPPPLLRPEALQRLLSHPYPGNIRELRNLLERALLLSGGDELGTEHFALPPSADAPSPAGTFLAELPLRLDEAEDLLIARALAVAEGNMSQAARLLGINRASLYRWQSRRAAHGHSP